MKHLLITLFVFLSFNSYSQCNLEQPPTMDLIWRYWLYANPVSADQNIHICPDSYIQFTVAINSPYNFVGHWNDGSTDFNTVPVNSGSWFYTLININGCSYSTPVATVFNDAMAIDVPHAVKSGCYLKCVSSIAETYRWYRNDFEISGATNQNYLPSLLGKYKVRITSGGCYSDSKEVKVTAVCGGRNSLSTDEDREVVSLRWYDVYGNVVSDGYSGLVIAITRYSDGSQSTSKSFVSK